MTRCRNCQDPIRSDEALCEECKTLDPSQHGSACSCEACEPAFGDESDQIYWRRASAAGSPL